MRIRELRRRKNISRSLLYLLNYWYWPRARQNANFLCRQQIWIMRFHLEFRPKNGPIVKSCTPERTFQLIFQQNFNGDLVLCDFMMSIPKAVPMTWNSFGSIKRTAEDVMVHLLSPYETCHLRYLASWTAAHLFAGNRELAEYLSICEGKLRTWKQQWFSNFTLHTSL